MSSTTSSSSSEIGSLPGSSGSAQRPARVSDHEAKLYLVVRSDLTFGSQATQLAHVALRHGLDHPEQTAQWEQTSGSLITLAAPDLAALHELELRARAAGIKTTAFREHDLGHELTALALAPGASTRALLSELPLTGRVGAATVATQKALARRARSMRELVESMESTEQTAGLSVLAHGVSVWEHTQLLLDHLTGRIDLAQTHAQTFRLPSWLTAHREVLAAQVLPAWVIERYTVLHDCGKPAVRTVGEDGRVHFPDHAAVSASTFARVQGLDTPEDRALHSSRVLEGLDVAALLVAGDMNLHLARAEDIPALAQVRVSLAGQSYPLVLTQLLVALAEITANAAMFGGVDSTGFAMKFKHIERRGRQVCKLLFPEGSA